MEMGMKTDHFRISQNFIHYDGIVWKYIVVSVAAKMSLNFRCGTAVIPKNSSKCPENAIFTFLAFQSTKASAL